ncbi:MAG: DUF4396 domain-containing protein [Bacteroidota bacterium]
MSSATLTLPTNLHCSACVEKIEPILNEEKSIQDWSVDLEPDVKTLSIQGNDITEDYVDRLLQKAGYAVVREQGTKTGNFWGDAQKWKRASFNTLNCLIGCSIGDFGMIIFLQAYYSETSIMTQMILAIIAGLTTSVMLETIIMKVREQFGWKEAFQTAISMSFISMIAMEIAMNVTDFAMTGGKAAFADPMYWIALAIALLPGFLVPLPYNYYKLKKFNKACH